ncbi:MAG: PEP/pyruvate-binding domain-containing protein, partial [Gemmatimonadota bacterium]
ARHCAAGLAAALVLSAPARSPAAPVAAAPFPADQVHRLVETLKRDPRGPFRAIRWFCPDGSVQPADTPCAEPGGAQHGLPRDDVQALARDHGVYLGQVLTGTPFETFLDSARQNSRLQQYHLSQYLESIDDGWIMRRARYYRGALQVEGEEAWSRDFLAWMLGQDQLLASQFLLCRQAVRVLPHRVADQQGRAIRNLATAVSELLPAFVDLRNRIHSQPGAGDSARVALFRHEAKLPAGSPADSLLAELQVRLGAAYRTVGLEQLRAYLKVLRPASPLYVGLHDLLELGDGETRDRAVETAELLWRIRVELPRARPGAARLTLVDLSLDLEDVLYRLAPAWQPRTPAELLEKSYVLGRAAAGAGYLEMWEWEAIDPVLSPPALRLALPPAELLARVDGARRGVAWGAAALQAVYGATAERYTSFEPRAVGFVDDLVRGSILLPWGAVAGDLARLGGRYSGLTNDVAGLPAGDRASGLNPGYALGELVVVAGSAAAVEFSDRCIYVLERPPSDLRPVAGIATVSEGNAVSHVQLLARNLGIPNAVVSPELLAGLQPLSGRTVFYAVSPRGRVILKPAEAMSAEEKALFAVRQRSEARIAVPTDRLDASSTRLRHLSTLRAVDSGRLCGPKAANLGELDAMFPGLVAPGLVIPFGVFRVHMAQPMPGTAGTYWEFLQQVFAAAAQARQDSTPEDEVEAATLAGLARLRQAVRDMPLLPGFTEDLERNFEEAFDAPLGEVAVFVRSDTNMEDLRDFTGAGLNLTVPNALAPGVILQAIRDVWASPFAERSYRWRQKYLLNPENVYPSILLLQSVNVDKSGVLVTAGLASQNPDDLTAAFSRGVGGAVEGQAAETWLLRRTDGEVLLSPSREPRYTVLPASGGVARAPATFEAPVLSAPERARLRYLGDQIRQRLPTFPGISSAGPFDVELGFLDGEPWLFQARPFVESKRARASLYLRGLDPAAAPAEWVDLQQALP